MAEDQGSVLARIEATLGDVLAGMKRPEKTTPTAPDFAKASSGLRRQEELMAMADKGYVPEGFQGDNTQFKQALAQAYLQQYADQSESLGPTAQSPTPMTRSEARATAEDANAGHVGYGLEWARKNAGLRPY